MATMNCSIGRRHASLVAVIICFLVGIANGDVVLIGRNLTMSFDDTEAAFGLEIEEPGVRGLLYLAEPLDACAPLTTRLVNSSRSKFVLIMRGGCTFDEKVRRAQDAGFDLAIVYDDEYHKHLITMAGDDNGINISAIFISLESGETLMKYAGDTDIDIIITTSYRIYAWSATTIFFISLLAVCSLAGMCCFVRRRRHEPLELPRFYRPSGGDTAQQDGMSSHLVKAMPCVVYDPVMERNGTNSTCVICLEDYVTGDKLRVLPCKHKFHIPCIDSWLMKWRTFCPVCKHDARISSKDPPATESTPLLSLRLPPLPAVTPANPSLTHFIPFSNYFSFINRATLSRILQRGSSSNYTSGNSATPPSEG
ncbi:receptor homology region, transmembrane domain- and RING domain-containing protein 2-like isoform X1 [Carex littledalei]|uniref:Receptor homology region, transmembrane domain-and RING domain-containing protein 2-like isoform X1 n=1 Tax=Carex littledalei TaxID=544730 RepID=A0A833R2Q1_9POAL|nr:receptor homology region, transmembrane domain- and RING domain-containing protein 2-like isoform X1 [Carex littledalei]